MGTKAQIVYQNSSIRYLNNHIDGYISNLGSILYKNFDSKALDELFAQQKQIYQITTPQQEKDRKNRMIGPKGKLYYSKNLAETDNHIINNAFVKYFPASETIALITSEKEILNTCVDSFVYFYDNSWKVSAYNLDFVDMKIAMDLLEICSLADIDEIRKKSYYFLNNNFTKNDLKFIEALALEHDNNYELIEQAAKDYSVIKFAQKLDKDLPSKLGINKLKI